MKWCKNVFFFFTFVNSTFIAVIEIKEKFFVFLSRICTVYGKKIMLLLKKVTKLYRYVFMHILLVQLGLLNFKVFAQIING